MKQTCSDIAQLVGVYTEGDGEVVAVPAPEVQVPATGNIVGSVLILFV